MGIDVAEASKKLDPTTSLYYFGARYYPDRGFSGRDPSDSAWAGRWMSVDPLASKYPGWIPYNYATDSPSTLLENRLVNG